MILPKSLITFHTGQIAINQSVMERGEEEGRLNGPGETYKHQHKNQG